MRTLAKILSDGEDLSVQMIRGEISIRRGAKRLRELMEEYQARRFWIKNGTTLKPLKEYM